MLQCMTHTDSERFRGTRGTVRSKAVYFDIRIISSQLEFKAVLTYLYERNLNNSVSLKKLDSKMSQNRDMDRKVADFSNIFKNFYKIRKK